MNSPFRVEGESFDGTLVKVRVVPNASRELVRLQPGEEALRVYVKAPPVGGRANKEVLRVFKGLFGESEIKSGLKSRNKVILVKKKSRTEILDKIERI